LFFLFFFSHYYVDTRFLLLLHLLTPTQRTTCDRTPGSNITDTKLSEYFIIDLEANAETYDGFAELDEISADAARAVAKDAMLEDEICSGFLPVGWQEGGQEEGFEAAPLFEHLEAYYAKHAPGEKTVFDLDQITDHCVQENGTAWLNAPLQDKYGQSLADFISEHTGVPIDNAGLTTTKDTSTSTAAEDGHGYLSPHDTSTSTVVLARNAAGHGIKFGGPRDEDEAHTQGGGIIITKVTPGSAADQNPNIEAGMQVVRLNNCDLTGGNVQDLKEALRGSLAKDLTLELRDKIANGLQAEEPCAGFE